MDEDFVRERLEYLSRYATGDAARECLTEALTLARLLDPRDPVLFRIESLLMLASLPADALALPERRLASLPPGMRWRQGLEG